MQAVVAARLDALPERLRELTRHASAFFVSFDADELAVVDPGAQADELRRSRTPRSSFARRGRGPGPRWRLRHATLKDVAYASLPKRERVRLHRLIADRLIASGHPSWASDHLELAAVASLDLDPNDRAMPETRRRRAGRLGGPREATDGEPLGGRLLPSRPGDRRPRGAVGRPRGACARRHGRGSLLARRLRGRDRGARARRGARHADDDPFTLALALRFLGDIAINVEGDLDAAEELLDRSLAAAEELGDPWAIARTLLFAGWVPWTRDRYAEAEAIWRRALAVADPEDGWARVRALNSLSINLTGGPGVGPRAATAPRRRFD